MGKPANERAIKVTKAKEASYFFHSGWCWPVRNTFDFDRVHLNFTLSNDDPDVLNLLFVEEAFLWFEEEVICC
jgi:hypothetical protein